MPKELPHIYIIDPKSKEPIKDSEDFYVKKYQNFIFNISQPQKELNEIIEKFMDDKLSMHYVTEDREQETKVKWLNSEIFEQEIIKNPEVKQCVIEIFKDHCPACFIAKFNTNVISRKLDKHGLLDQLPFYRMKITN